MKYKFRTNHDKNINHLRKHTISKYNNNQYVNNQYVKSKVGNLSIRATTIAVDDTKHQVSVVFVADVACK